MKRCEARLFFGTGKAKATRNMFIFRHASRWEEQAVLICFEQLGSLLSNRGRFRMSHVPPLERYTVTNRAKGTSAVWNLNFYDVKKGSRSGHIIHGRSWL